MTMRDVPLDEQPAWWRATVKFVASIKDVPWFNPQGEPDPTWRVFDTGDAARAAARDAARAAARDAAWDAARAAARDAAGATARDAAGDAARGAALMACIHITADLDVDEKHRAHARARWDVWCRGYGLAYDVSGVLYVYKKPT